LNSFEKPRKNQLYRPTKEFGGREEEGKRNHYIYLSQKQREKKKNRMEVGRKKATSTKDFGRTQKGLGGLQKKSGEEGRLI